MQLRNLQEWLTKSVLTDFKTNIFLNKFQSIMKPIKAKQKAKILIFSAILCTSNAYAGPYADALQKCLLNSIDQNEKKTMVRWIHSILSSHPDLSTKKPYNNTELAEIDRSMAFIYTRLTTQACKKESTQIIKYEPENIKITFGTLGRHAVESIMKDSNVTFRSQQFSEYLDMDYINQATKDSIK